MSVTGLKLHALVDVPRMMMNPFESYAHSPSRASLPSFHFLPALHQQFTNPQRTVIGHAETCRLSRSSAQKAP